MSATSNIVIAGVVGLALGFAGGYFVGDQGAGQPPTPPAMRAGAGGMTPSERAASVPPGTWCKVNCGGMQACAILDQIQSLAQADLGTASITPLQLERLNDLLLKCAVNLPPANVGAAEHCQKVNAARQAALQHNWTLCIEHMEHGH